MSFSHICQMDPSELLLKSQIAAQNENDASFFSSEQQMLKWMNPVGVHLFLLWTPLLSAQVYGKHWEFLRPVPFNFICLGGGIFFFNPLVHMLASSMQNTLQTKTVVNWTWYIHICVKLCLSVLFSFILRSTSPGCMCGVWSPPCLEKGIYLKFWPSLSLLVSHPIGLHFFTFLKMWVMGKLPALSSGDTKWYKFGILFLISRYVCPRFLWPTSWPCVPGMYLTLPSYLLVSSISFTWKSKSWTHSQPTFLIPPK